MSPANVKEAEKGITPRFVDGGFALRTEVSGLSPELVSTSSHLGKLVEPITRSLARIRTQMTSWDDFENITRSLSEKYGQPSSNDKEWRDSPIAMMLHIMD